MKSIIFGAIILGFMFLSFGALFASSAGIKKSGVSGSRINHNNLVSATDRKNLPSESGVYFIINSKRFDQVYYIGSSKNIKSRLSNHSTLKLIIEDMGADKISITWLTADESKIGKIEQSMINQFKPPYNKLMVVTR